MIDTRRIDVWPNGALAAACIALIISLSCGRGQPSANAAGASSDKPQTPLLTKDEAKAICEAYGYKQVKVIAIIRDNENSIHCAVIGVSLAGGHWQEINLGIDYDKDLGWFKWLDDVEGVAVSTSKGRQVIKP